MARWTALVLAWTVACSGDPRDPGGDGGPPVRVTLETTSPPMLVGFRHESSSEWQMLDTAGKSTFEFSVSGLYRIVVACSNSVGGISVNEYARAPTDDPAIRFFCDPLPFTVKGMVSQRGFVGLGTRLATIDAQLSFQLAAVAGSFDLVHLFLSGAMIDRIALMRDVAITGNTDLGLVDLTQNSQALVSSSYTVTNLASETVYATARLYSGSSVVPLPTSSSRIANGTFQLAPEGMLRATDRQVMELRGCVFVSGGNRDRVLRRNIHVGDPAMLALPDPVGPVTFTATGDRLEAAASSLPDHDRVFLSRQSDSDVVGPTINAHGILVSRSFREATAAATVVLDLSDVPGFRPDWRIDPATQHVALQAIRGTSNDEVMTSSSVSQPISARLLRPGRMRIAFSPENAVEPLEE